MAQLEAAQPERWSAQQTQAQYLAIAWLRWRILMNGFRRKGGKGDLFARILSIPLIVALILLPTIGAGFLSWYFAANGKMEHEVWLLWGIFFVSQLVNLNLGQPGTTFDPTELVRFPMRLRSYVAIRLFFGLLAPSNVVAACMSMSLFIGITIALPHLWLYAAMALLVFATTNILFTRMIFSWIDRWMSTRRAREVFTAVVFVVSLGFQYLNVTFNPAYNSHHTKHVSQERIATGLSLYHHIEPVLAALPPGCIGNALVKANTQQPALALLSITACAVYAAFFLAVFALRMKTEFGGENLSDTANAISQPKPRHTTAPLELSANQITPVAERSFLGISPTVFTVFSKEFLYLRRNTGVFYGLVAPLVMVLLFAGKLASRHNGWVFPGALAYTMLGLAPFAYNSFGLEGAGTQFYFLAPVRLRDVILAKNMMNFIMAIVEGAAVFGIITYLNAPPSATTLVATGLWTVGTMLFNMTVGNFRSIAAPKKMNLNRTSGKQASPLSSLLSLGLLLIACAFGAGLLLGAPHFHLNWLVIPAMALYAAIGIVTYLLCLRTMDRYTLDRRESMFEELCKRS